MASFRTRLRTTLAGALGRAGHVGQTVLTAWLRLGGFDIADLSGVDREPDRRHQRPAAVGLSEAGPGDPGDGSDAS
jgi:hypothetical protein